MYIYAEEDGKRGALRFWVLHLAMDGDLDLGIRGLASANY